MEKYEKPIMEIIEINGDVITASPCDTQVGEVCALGA